MDDRPGCLKPPHLAPDAELVAQARDGDRTAFGVLYLRHHAAAWRLASATSGFTDDAELAVLAGFTEVFSSLPR
ncbi:MAG: sigma-70 family RNA polymerase sigma factor, partial [Acidimicrobiia bacterium]